MTSKDSCTLCEAGHYCPEATAKTSQIKCDDPQYYCPEGSPHPLYVYPGYYTDEDTAPLRNERVLCPPGFYCPGDGSRYKCPAGTININTDINLYTIHVL